MNLNQIYYFVTLAKTEHYTRAAEQLSITQPTLSHAVSMLENELGIKLFEKKGRNVVLTKYGKVFLGYASESLRLLETGIKNTKSMGEENTGTIDLAYIFTLGTEFVPQLVQDFLKDNPQLHVQFKFKVGYTPEILQGLKEQKFDLAFCSKIEREKQVIFTPIAEENLVAAVSKNHPLAVNDEITLAETAEYPQIFYPQSSGLRSVIEKLFEKAGVRPEIAYEIDEDNAMAGLAAKNFGVAVMPEVPVLKNLDIKKLPITNPEIHRYIYMAQVKNRYQVPVVKKFAAYVKKYRGILAEGI